MEGKEGDFIIPILPFLPFHPFLPNPLPFKRIFTAKE